MPQINYRLTLLFLSDISQHLWTTCPEAEVQRKSTPLVTVLQHLHLLQNSWPAFCYKSLLLCFAFRGHTFTFMLSNPACTLLSETIHSFWCCAVSNSLIMLYLGTVIPKWHFVKKYFLRFGHTHRHAHKPNTSDTHHLFVCVHVCEVSLIGSVQ